MKHKKCHIITLLSLYCIVSSLYLKDLIFGFDSIFQVVVFIVVMFVTIFSRTVFLKENAFSFYSLYYITFLIFIGGSFIAYPFTEKNLVCRDVFGHICLDAFIISKAFFLLISAILFIEIGYVIASKKIKEHEALADWQYKQMLFATVSLGCIFFPLLFFSTYHSVEMNFSKGYLSSFIDSQGEQYSTPASLLYLLIISTFLGFSYILRNRYPKIFLIYFTLFIVNSIVSVLAGGRAGFVTALLMVIWVKYRDLQGARHLFRFIAFGVLIVILTNMLMLINGRSTDSEVGISKLFFNLIDAQGISFFVFSLSTMVEDYPLLAYFKTILPGSVHLYNFFIESVPSYMAAFPNYLAWKIDPSLYSYGYALGWSLFSDFYLFSLGFYPIYLFFGCCWGAFLSRLGGQSNYTEGLLLAIMPVLLMINRATLSALVSYCIFYTILFFLITRVRYFR